MTEMTGQGSGTNRAGVSALQSTPRRILGDVSTNIRTMAAPKPLDSSSSEDFSLKRSLSSTLENESGFTYLKKRKLSSDRDLVVARTPNQENFQAPRITAQAATPMPNPVQYTKTSRFSQPTLLDVPTRSIDGDAGSDTSIERKSFSSLINYDPSSQNAVSSQDQKKLFRGPSYAEQLKLRLRLATYKMRTNQIQTPFDDLKENKPSPTLPNCSEAEEVIAQLRAEAQLRMPPAVYPTHSHPAPSLTLLPRTTLLPTNYSSRMLYDRDQRMRSSPPATASPYRIPAELATPAVAQRRETAEEQLTSSIVKGRVAEGLLGLRHAV